MNTESMVLVGVIVALVRVVEVSVAALVKKKNGNTSVLSDDERSWLKDLHEMHDHRDQDGVFTWWVPRSWASTQEKIIDAQREISENQRRTVEILERIERKMGK